jgi:hypothetical protein
MDQRDAHEVSAHRLLILTFYQQNHAANSQESTCQWTIWNIVCGVLGCVYRPHIQNLATGLKSECTPDYDYNSDYN